MKSLKRIGIGFLGALAVAGALLVDPGGETSGAPRDRLSGRSARDRIAGGGWDALLRLLSPPGAGYDATNLSLTTGNGGAVTFARASTWTCQDSTGAIRSLASGKPCVVDGLSLKVRSAVGNNLTSPTDLSNAAYTKSNITLATDGTLAPDGTAATKVSATASAATLIQQAVVVAATSATCSYVVKKGSGATDANTFALRNNTTSTILQQITINYDTLAITHAVGSGASAVQYANGWIRISIPASTGITSGNSIQCYQLFIGGAETAGEYAYWHQSQLTPGSTVAGDICNTSSCVAETATVEVTPAPSAAQWCVRARISRASDESAWNDGVGGAIWGSNVAGNGNALLYVSTSGGIALDIQGADGITNSYIAGGALTTEASATVRVCYSTAGPTISTWKDGVPLTVTAFGAGTGILPGFNTTHVIGVNTSTLQLRRRLDSLCFSRSLTGCQ